MHRHDVVRLFERLGWSGNPGLAEAEVSGLEANLGVTFPPDYRAFPRWSGGGDDWLGEAYVSINSAEDMRLLNNADFRTLFPGLVLVGGNGGGEGYCLDHRADAAQPSFLAIDLTNSDEDSHWPLGPSFTEAMRRLSIKGHPWPPDEAPPDP